MHATSNNTLRIRCQKSSPQTHLSIQHLLHHKTVQKQKNNRANYPPTMAIGLPNPMKSQPPAVVRCVALVSLALIIFATVIVIIIWLAVQPKRLNYSVELGSISGYNFTNDHLITANFRFVLRTENPNNRVSFYYDKIVVKVSYEEQNLCADNVPPFYQRSGNVTRLDLNMAAKDAAVHGGAAEDLEREQESGDLDVEVKLRAKIRIKIGLLRVHRTLKVVCGPLKVPFSSSKVFKRVRCDVDTGD
ncbi:hypothetical protein CDL12_28562 [Handroanthus impetiginosus]|uniref:Late embryogenesis abundant protein LEA-2 subgroup domain-containing protein n=1 Tax=Handroanthus impetiginosus TaxID=429701 RepID=A0A2G9G224_9LAMI|nr:hypothetical protein CDL12_28562 [Handroanthus impetiginosus]